MTNYNLLKVFILTLILSFTACNGKLEIKEDNKDLDYTITAKQLSLSAGTEKQEKTIELKYETNAKAAEGLSLTCSLSNLVNLTESTKCNCDTNWKCSVGLTPTKKGTASFAYKFSIDEKHSKSLSVSFEVGGEAFVSVWKTSSAGEVVTLPLRENFNYNMIVDWGDGSEKSTVTAWDDSDKSHTYTDAGEYTITITGLAEAWYHGHVDNVTSRNQIIKVSNLGNLGWKNLEIAFGDCSKITSFAGGNVSQVTNMSGTFRGMGNINLEFDINDWDTSQVTTMSGIFSRVTYANPDISEWNISNVTDLSSAFSWTNNMNPDLSNWDTSSVQKFNSMFHYASKAQPDTSRWNTSSATNFSSMFSMASKANPDVSNWDTSKVTSTFEMFNYAGSANPDVSNWNTSSLVFMEYMFNFATAANPDLSKWDFSAGKLGLQQFLYKSNISSTNYANFLNKFVQTYNASYYSNVSNSSYRILHATGNTYDASGATARAQLVSSGWSVYDEGQAP